jgi:hypothetical protein
LGFGEAGAIALVGAARELASLGAHHPSDFVLGRLMTVGTVQRCHFPFGALVEKIAFFHEIVVGR